MNDDLHDIDKLFRDGINEHREPLLPEVWENINRNLDKQQAAHFKRKYYKLRRLLFVFLLFAIGGGGFLIVDQLKQKNANKESAITTQKEIVPQKAETTDKTSSTKNVSVKETEKPNDDKVINNEEENITEEKSDNTSTDNEIVLNSKTKPIKETKGVNSDDLLTQVDITNKKLMFTKLSNDNVLEKNTASSIKNKINTRPTLNKALDVYELKKQFTNDFIPSKNYSLLIKLQHPEAAEKKWVSETNDKEKKKTAPVHPLSLAIMVSPNLSFDRLEDNDRLSGPGRNENDFRQAEHAALSFSTGASLDFGLTKKLSLESGIMYTYSSTNIGAKTVYAKDDGSGHAKFELHCSPGYSYISAKGTVQPSAGDSAKLSGGTIALSYLGVPLAVNFALQKGKFILKPTVGVVNNFLLTGKTKTSLANGSGTENSTNSIAGLKSFYLDGRVGLGAEYELNKKLSIGVRPTARIALSPINQQTPVSSYQNYFSIEAGVRIKL